MLHIHSVKTNDVMATVQATADEPAIAAHVLSYLLVKMATDILMEHNTGELDDSNWEPIREAVSNNLKTNTPLFFTITLHKHESESKINFSIGEKNPFAVTGEGTVHQNSPLEETV